LLPVTIGVYTVNNLSATAVESSRKNLVLQPGVWTYTTIRWADLGNPTQVSIINFMGNMGTGAAVVNFDEIKLLSAALPAVVPMAEMIFSDALNTDWANYSYDATSFDMANTTKFKVGAKSIKCTPTESFHALSLFRSAPFDPANYPNGISFWAFGETATETDGKVKFQVFTTPTAEGVESTKKQIQIPTGVWTPVTISWADLGRTTPLTNSQSQKASRISMPNDLTAVQRINIQNTTNAGGQVFYVDQLTLSPTSPLPVNLISFEIKLIEKEIRLFWKTSTETNSQGFDIERSSNAKNWGKLSFISSKADAGNNAGNLEYAFVDKNPLSGINYYRLKQKDINGDFSFSAIKSINFSEKGSFEIFPNPTDGLITIETPDWNKINTLELYNTSGIKVLNGKTTSNKLDIRQLPAGTYMLKIKEFNGEIVMKKILKFE
jgi:hypothetical protein